MTESDTEIERELEMVGALDTLFAYRIDCVVRDRGAYGSVPVLARISIGVACRFRASTKPGMGIRAGK